MSQSRELINEIYEHTGLIFSEFRAKGFQKLIDKKIEESCKELNAPNIKEVKEFSGYMTEQPSEKKESIDDKMNKVWQNSKAGKYFSQRNSVKESEDYCAETVMVPDIDETSEKKESEVEDLAKDMASFNKENDWEIYRLQAENLINAGWKKEGKDG